MMFEIAVWQIPSFSYFFQVNLRLILVSGRTKEFLFTHASSAADITDHVYSNWPAGKSPLSCCSADYYPDLET